MAYDARHRTNGYLAPHWRELVEDAHLGRITLFLGAGVSLGRGLPTWAELIDRVAKAVNWSPKTSAWLRLQLDSHLALPHPLAFQMLFEQIEAHLRSQAKHAANPLEQARTDFATHLRSELYRGINASAVPSDSLSHIVSAIRADQQRERPRMLRVITLNADSLLEEGANAGFHPAKNPVVWPISRASHHPRRGDGANGRPPVPVYHVHGYLPQSNADRREAADSLVFTDAQYWRAVASPNSFANRVVANALHDSHCIFIGMSMTDLNLMRWLGIHAGEVEADKTSEFALCDSPVNKKEKTSILRAIRKTLRRHFWVRPAGGAETRFISTFLNERGVVSVAIADWHQSFGDLMRACFLDDARRPA